MRGLNRLGLVPKRNQYNLSYNKSNMKKILFLLAACSILLFGCTLMPVSQNDKEQPAKNKLAGDACRLTDECKGELKCNNGICQTNECIDSDNGTNPLDTKGTIRIDNTITEDIVSEDFCRTEQTIVEFSCGQTSGWEVQDMSCPQGTVCDAGACN